MLNEAKALLRQELDTDRFEDDVTAQALFSASDTAFAEIVAKQSGVFFGQVVFEAFEDVAPQIRMRPTKRDGQRLETGDVVAQLDGRLASCLAVERTLLNLLSHLSGVATLTRQFVSELKSDHTQILATRKTLPGLRELQLAAVVAGGGQVHRRSLSDGILIKDNHLCFVGVKEAIERAKRNRSPLHRVEIEIDRIEDLPEALAARPDVIMLDNFSFETLTKAVQQIDRCCAIEVSGGVSVDQVAQVSALGVDYISVGRLTHSVTALDLSMEFSKTPLGMPV